MAKISIQRTRHLSGYFIPYSLYLNGRNYGLIKSGSRMDFELEDGNYSLQASSKFSNSNVVNLECSHGKFFHLELGSDVDMLENIVSIVKYPALLVALYFIDKLVNWNYFLLVSIILLIIYHLVDKYLKKQKPEQEAKNEKYYIYLREIK
ncbi:MAG: hypothetical protein IPH84_10345 [Bacteroidales bacterium]|nr:hypothetical protein [Bacteroidales bacterium]